jgi:arylformamidase
MAKIYDVSMPITLDIPVYKNKPEKRPEFTVTSDHSQNGVRESRIALDVHTGTHVDAPLHMVQNGDTIETIAIENLIGPCKVLDLTQVKDAIHRSDLASVDIEPGDFVLFKTTNSNDTAFNPEFVFLAADAAEYLAECGIKGVGIDALGVERSQPGHPTHKALFGAGVIVVEGLQLSEVPRGEYQLVALPLRLVGLDAAPARVILVDEQP